MGNLHQETDCPEPSLIVVDQRENEVGLFSFLSISSGVISTMGDAPLSLAYARTQLWPTTVLPQPFNSSTSFRFEVCKRYVMILSNRC